MEISAELQMPTAALMRIDKDDTQIRSLSWTDTDAAGDPVCRMVTLERRGNVWTVEIEDWDTYTPNPLARGSGAVIMEKL